MKRLLFLLSVIALCDVCYAQGFMHVYYKNGTLVDIPIEEIDSLTFSDKSETEQQSVDVTLTGSWLWGSVEAGYYELLTFNPDNTYTGYDNYFSYGFDSMTYGWYANRGALLTLWSNGYGYQFRYNWYVMALTDNALSVMTKMGRFTYYRLQPEVLYLQVGQSLPCADGESIVFVDGVVVKIEDNALLGLSPGTTYILKRKSDDTILAYQVVVDA